MSSIIGSIWRLWRAYTPVEKDATAARANGRNPRTPKKKSYGAFKATYVYPILWRRPKNDQEAQMLYNHTRTVAYWLDDAPLLTDLGIPFKVGLDEIISLVPIYGDIVAGILGLYQVYLSALFGIEWQVLGWMLAATFVDILVGIVPLIGDYLDYLWKANLKNLNTLEDWLLTSPQAQRYHILLVPKTKNHDFIPPPLSSSSSSRFGGAFGFPFGSSSNRTEPAGAASTGPGCRVEKTRRMTRQEADSWGQARHAASASTDDYND